MGTHGKSAPKSRRYVRWGKLTVLVVAAHWCIHFSWYLYETLAVYVPIPNAKVAAAAVGKTPVFSVPTIVALLVAIDVILERAKKGNDHHE